ncbi:MAG: DUF3696 domain-containing protein [Candidatus Poribacteria bacterium]|nr:DUF3696 domain-containing protein [Candidatus Poribacteria bacterium]
MITHIRMKNFKSWADSGEVKLAPLTGFFGTNSSGKSSLLQMLLLLKQSAEHSITEEILFFGDETSPVNLGNLSEVVHGHRQKGSLKLEFGGKLETPISIDYSYPDESGLIKQVSFTTDRFTFDLTIVWNRDVVAVDNIHYLLKSGDDEYKAQVDINSKKIQGDPLRAKSMNLPKNQLSFEFENLFSHVYYLGPTRVHPQRLYHWQGTHPKKIDQSGSEAIDAVLSAGVRKLKSSNREDATLIEDRISEWLQKMDLAHSFRVIPTSSLDDQNYEVRLQKSPSSAEVTLADIGYGLADVLPMLVYCYYVEEGSTLILEQPGIHLHPKVQSELADFFIEVVDERKLQILVESHSEHLLTRLQRRIAEKQIPEENVALYFCRNNDGASTIEKLEVDGESGDIKNWPENFFGDVMGDMFAMTDKQVETIAETEPEG